MANDDFITKYYFNEDKSKTGRVLEKAKVGGVYISRLTIKPKQITGGYYHKKTNTIVIVEKGTIQMKFIQIKTGEEKEMTLKPGSDIVHVPPFTAFARRNVGTGTATLIIFSNRPLRSGDDFPFEVYKK